MDFEVLSPFVQSVHVLPHLQEHIKGITVAVPIHCEDILMKCAINASSCTHMKTKTAVTI